MKVHAFNDVEGLRIAVAMERRGAELYERAERVTKSEEARALLTRLARDERRHAAEFERHHARALADKLDEGYAYDHEANAFLTAIAADIVFPGGLVGLSKDRGLDSPAAILAAAIQSEKDSILYYGEMVRVARGEAARESFREIAAQERTHLSELEQMARSWQ